MKTIVNKLRNLPWKTKLILTFTEGLVWGAIITTIIFKVAT